MTPIGRARIADRRHDDERTSGPPDLGDTTDAATGDDAGDDESSSSSIDPEDAVDWIERVMRVGWLAKGFVFVVIGVLALDLAFGTSFGGSGGSGERADQRGALRSIAEEPVGTALLIAIAGGLAVFAVWKLVQAFAARSTDVDPLGVAKRLGWAGLGLFYGALGWTALELALGSSGAGRSDGTSPSALTARVMAATGGRWLVGGVGAVVLIVAAYHLRKGLTYDFVDDLATDDLDESTERWIGRFGVGGFVARAVVLAVSGWFLIRAAVRFDPSEAVGLDGALRQLTEVTYGRAVLGAVSVGLLVAGVYDMATFRRQRM